jgi:hypothetical protein
MAQQLLNDADIRPGLQELGRERVSEAVRGQFNAGHRSDLADLSPDRGWLQVAAAVGGEHPWHLPAASHPC